jgi:predicted DNA-binding transcriptional regulator AlpA
VANTSASPDVLMSVRELAAYLDVSIPTIYDWSYRAKRGQNIGPPIHRAGNLLRYRKSEVDAWLAREQEQAQ